jgi:prefoldin subunit 5
MGSNDSNPNRKQNLMKQVVMLVEKRHEIKKQSNELHEKIETLQNLKQEDKARELIEKDFELFLEYGQNVSRENMLLNQATVTNRNFKFN